MTIGTTIYINKFSRMVNRIQKKIDTVLCCNLHSVKVMCSILFFLLGNKIYKVILRTYIGTIKKK